MFLANNVYGKHGGPYQPGTSLGLLFHLLSGGDHDLQGFNGHVIGGMGAIANALASAAKKHGVEIRTSASVARIDVRNGRAQGVFLDDGTEIKSRVLLSNADPKRTFLGLVHSNDLPEEFREKIRGIKMAGPCAKVNMVLGQGPNSGQLRGERRCNNARSTPWFVRSNLLNALRHRQIRSNS